MLVLTLMLMPRFIMLTLMLMLPAVGTQCKSGANNVNLLIGAISSATGDLMPEIVPQAFPNDSVPHLSGHKPDG